MKTPKWKCLSFEIPKALAVYPALLLFTTCMFASGICFRYALQDVICYDLHKELMPKPLHHGKNSSSPNINCATDKAVVAATGQWNGVLVTALGLTSCVTSGTVAALTDRYGRRSILGLAAFGQTINAVIVLLCLVYNLNPYYFVIGYALNGLTGGYPAFLACAFAYVADLTSKEDRPVIFGGGESMLFLGGVVGPVLIGYVLKHYQHYVAVCVLAIISTVLVLYIYSIPKSRHLKKNNDEINHGATYDNDTDNRNHNNYSSSSNNNTNDDLSMLQLFYKYNIFTVIIALCKRQKEVVFVVFSFMCYFVGLLGASVLTGQYTELKFKWGPEQFGIYSAASTGMLAFGIWFFTALFLKGPKCTKMHELDIMRLSALSRGLMYILSVFATNATSFYAVSGINIFGGLLMPLTRSTVSKSFSQNEQGVALTAVAAVEAVSTLWLPIVFGFLFKYSATVLDSPELFLYVCGISSVIGFIILCFAVTRKGFDSIENSYSPNNEESLKDQLLNNNSAEQQQRRRQYSGSMMNNVVNNEEMQSPISQQTFHSPDRSSGTNSTSPNYIY